MATDCVAQLTFKDEHFPKPIVVRFDMPHARSDGGAILLKALDARLRLTEQLAACVEDSRQPAEVRASLGSPVATPTATTPRGWSTTRSTSS